jgi:hypothetical protein
MKTKRINLFLAVTLALLISGVTAVPGRAAESDKKSKENVKAPEAVLAAFHKTYPKATIRDISQETKDKETYYEIESLDGTQRRDLLYHADGTVFEIEEAINIGDLPKEVTTGLSAKFPGGKLQKAERITRGSKVEYEVLLEYGEDNLEVLLDSNGKIISQAQVNDEDEEKDNGEKDEVDED